MFTGIVEAVGRVSGLERGERRARLEIDEARLAAEVRVGESVAVGGACLTVTEAAGGRMAFDAVRETLDRTALGELAVDARVNLERALRADGRLDGHFVQGHVDGTGRVRALRREGEDVRLELGAPGELVELLVEKGSVAVDGVSLTVVGVEEGGFDVALVPHTLEATTLGALAEGTRVNLEADVLGKYVKRYVERLMRSGSFSGLA